MEAFAVGPLYTVVKDERTLNFPVHVKSQTCLYVAPPRVETCIDKVSIYCLLVMNVDHYLGRGIEENCGKTFN